MYDILVRYFARIDLNAQTFGATPENSQRCMEKFSSLGFMPVLANEQTQMGPVQRLGLQSISGLQVVIGTASTIIQLHGLPGTAAPPLDTFLESAAKVSVGVLELINVDATRLAVVQEGLLAERPPEGMSALRQKLLQLPDSIGMDEPFEWNWRAASKMHLRFGGHDEMGNKVLQISRVAGQIGIGGSQFDRIRVDLDVNTEPKDSRSRFNGSAAAAFFEEAKRWHSESSAAIQNEVLRAG